MGRSIPDNRLEDINKELEGDIMVRQVRSFSYFILSYNSSLRYFSSNYSCIWFNFFGLFSYCFLFLLIFFLFNLFIHSSALLTKNYSFLNRFKKKHLSGHLAFHGFFILNFFFLSIVAICWLFQHAFLMYVRYLILLTVYWLGI